MSKSLYLWESVDGLTKNYHAEGGLVIVTAGAYADVRPDLDLPEPDRVFTVGDDEADAVFIFPDSGCC